MLILCWSLSFCPFFPIFFNINHMLYLKSLSGNCNILSSVALLVLSIFSLDYWPHFPALHTFCNFDCIPDIVYKNPEAADDVIFHQVGRSPQPIQGSLFIPISQVWASWRLIESLLGLCLFSSSESVLPFRGFEFSSLPLTPCSFNN